jgi:hypothetical protein
VRANPEAAYDYPALFGAVASMAREAAG